MNFSIGDWIVKALELFERSPILRRMYYAALLIGLIYVLPQFIATIRWW